MHFFYLQLNPPASPEQSSCWGLQEADSAWNVGEVLPSWQRMLGVGGGPWECTWSPWFPRSWAGEWSCFEPWVEEVRRPGKASFSCFPGGLATCLLLSCGQGKLRLLFLPLLWECFHLRYPIHGTEPEGTNKGKEAPLWGPAAREKDCNRTLRAEMAIGIDTLNQKNKKTWDLSATRTRVHTHTRTLWFSETKKDFDVKVSRDEGESGHGWCLN